MFENLKDNGIDIKKIFLVLIFIIVLVVFLILRFASNGYIIVNESLILTKRNNKWVQISSLNKDILNKNYYVYSSDGKNSNVILNYSSNSFYYFNKNYVDLSLKKVKVAYTSGFKKLKLANYDFSFYDSSDDVFLKQVLGDKKIDYFKKSVIKSSYDLDNDGIIETIYTLTNYGLDGHGDFSTIFLVKGDQFIGKIDSDTKEPFLVQNIIDLDGNGKYEVIVSKGTVDVATFDTCYQIYSINGNNIKKIKGC